MTLRRILLSLRSRSFTLPVLLLLLPFGLLQAQELKITADSITIPDFIRRIEAQTPFTVAYSPADFDPAIKIPIPSSFVNIRLHDALAYLFGETQYSCTINGNHIIILPVERNQRRRPTENAMPLTLRNRLSDESTDYPAMEIRLDEIIITGKSTQSKIDRITYNVSPQMREGTVNAIDLLDKIHGVYYDKSTQTFKVNNRQDILLLLDGVQQSDVYIKNISSRQIRAIEVILEPTGRFLSEGYGAVINLIPQEDTNTCEVFVSDISAVNISAGGNAVKVKNRLAKEQPVAGISIMNKKISAYATYLFNRERWNMPMTRRLVYDGVSVPLINNQSDLYRSHSHNAGAGISYHPNKNHLLALQTNFAAGNMYSEYEYMTAGNVLSNISNRTLKNTTQNLNINSIFTAGASWQGRINRRLDIYGDLDYEYYYNDMESMFGLIDGNQTNNIDGNQYGEYKHRAGVNLEAAYRLSAKLSGYAGYTGATRTYASGSSHGKGFFDYNERRNMAFVGVSYNHSAAGFAGSVGFGVEGITLRNRNAVKHITRILPYMQIKFFHINVKYSVASHYPVLYQLSPMSIRVDSLLSQIGNPDLIPSVRHTIAVRFNRRDRLTIEPAVHFTRNAISESYIKSDYYLYRTFRNINTAEYVLYSCYDHALGRYLRLTGSLTLYYSSADGADDGDIVKNNLSGWLATVEANYYHPAHHFGVLVGYYRNMKKNILWQGYQTLDKDNYLLEVNKIFPRTGLAVTLSWIPPLSFGIRKEQLKRMDAPLYTEATNIRLDAYYNMLLLKISYRFNTLRK